MGVMFSVGARYVELRRLGFSHGGCCGGYGIPALCGDDSGGGRPGDYDGFDVEAGGGFDGGRLFAGHDLFGGGGRSGSDLSVVGYVECGTGDSGRFGSDLLSTGGVESLGGYAEFSLSGGQCDVVGDGFVEADVETELFVGAGRGVGESEFLFVLDGGPSSVFRSCRCLVIRAEAAALVKAVGSWRMRSIRLKFGYAFLLAPRPFKQV